MAAALRPLRDRLRAEAARLSVPFDVVERDYAIGHVLAATYAVPTLAASLVFKGGTALKKAYFGDYRFSVDLDFTAAGGRRGDALEAQVREAAAGVEEALNEYGPFRVDAVRRPEQREHPAGQEAFRVAIQFPWHNQPLCSIKLEITVDEPLLLAADSLPLLHGYDESLDATLQCYSLEEIVAEKLRTTLQAQKRLMEGRWPRNCARDYYDLWRLCGAHSDLVDFAQVANILPQKCTVRQVSAEAVDDFFPPVVVETAARQWDGSLANLVRRLPPFAAVVDELKQVLGAKLERLEPSRLGG